MPNTREKLIELLDIIIQPGEKTLGDIADHLIANGVTISNLETVNKEWIPVTERLPEENKFVLANRQGVSSVEFRCGCGWSYDHFTKFPVTHWMPLPEPPRGATE